MKPTKNIKKFLMELKKLNLPKGEYAVFSSAVLAIRGIRECKDLDIIVGPDLFEQLLKKYAKDIKKARQERKLKISPKVEAVLRDEDGRRVEEIIGSSDVFEGIKFANLPMTIEQKRKWGREKDLKDIELIEEYIKTGGK